MGDTVHLDEPPYVIPVYIETQGPLRCDSEDEACSSEYRQRALNKARMRASVRPYRRNEWHYCEYMHARVTRAWLRALPNADRCYCDIDPHYRVLVLCAICCALMYDGFERPYDLSERKSAKSWLRGKIPKRKARQEEAHKLFMEDMKLRSLVIKTKVL